MSRNSLRLAALARRLFATAALTAASTACVAEERAYESAFADPVYAARELPDQRAASVSASRPARYSEAYRAERAGFVGVQGARVAHRLYGDARAERFDGECEARVYIERGETLSDIAEYCDVPVAALLDANPDIANARAIAVGELVFVPAVTGEVYEGATRYRVGERVYDEAYLAGGDLEPRGEEGPLYKVRRGDTLAEIAQRFGVSLRAIARLNPKLEPRRLEIGQLVRLPDYAATAPRDRVDVARAPRDEARPIVSITPARGAPDSRIRILGDNFERGEAVTLYVSQDGGESFAELRVAETDGDGRIDETVRLPSDFEGERALFAMGADRYEDLIETEPFVIAARRAPRETIGGPVHVVREGETLAWIAARYDVSMAELRRLNDGVDMFDLERGARLRLPRDAALEALDAQAPVMSAAQRSVAASGAVTLVGEGFPANAPVTIYRGETPNDLEKALEVRTGSQGRFVADAPAPARMAGRAMIFVAAIGDGPRTILSEKILVRAPRAARPLERAAPGPSLDARAVDETEVAVTPEELVRDAEADRALFARRGGERGDRVGAAGEAAIVGVLTNEGGDCQALRDDAGELFTLLGDLEGFDDGDRVLVRGSVRADDRICGPSQTVRLFDVESAPW